MSKVFKNYFKTNLKESAFKRAEAELLSTELNRTAEWHPGDGLKMDIEFITNDEFADMKNIYEVDPLFRANVNGLAKKKAKKRLKKAGSSGNVVVVDRGRDGETSSTTTGAHPDSIKRTSDPSSLRKQHGASTDQRGTGDIFESTPFGQIVADEVNKAVSNLPEVRLATGILSEQELQDTYGPFARAVIARVKALLEDGLDDHVSQAIEDVKKEAENKQ